MVAWAACICPGPGGGAVTRALGFGLKRAMTLPLTVRAGKGLEVFFFLSIP